MARPMEGVKVVELGVWVATSSRVGFELCGVPQLRKELVVVVAAHQVVRYRHADGRRRRQIAVWTLRESLEPLPHQRQNLRQPLDDVGRLDVDHPQTRIRLLVLGDDPRVASALAQTANTAAMDAQTLVGGIDDLRRRFDEAGRDFSKIDITFTNFDGGKPGNDDFNADAYMSGLERLAAVGVTWVQVGIPGDSLAHVLETIDKFGEAVIRVG